MRGELLYVLHPHRVHLKWLIFWLIIILSSVFGLYQVAANVKTHDFPVGKMELMVPYTKYLVGEEVNFTLKNNYNATIFVNNACPGEPLMVYRQEAGKWVRIHDTASKQDCPTESRQIAVAPNGVVAGSFAKWKNLFATPGKYRIVAFVEYYNSLPYADIEVVDKAALAPPASSGVTAGTSAPVLAAKTQSIQQTSGTVATSTPAPVAPPQAPASSGGSSVTYDVYVRYDGYYFYNNNNNFTITLVATNKIRYTFLPACQSCNSEIVTRFTPISGTATGIAGFTIDNDPQNKVKTFAYNTKGSWAFVAQDHSANRPTLVVN
jgi:hypothetical protein